MPKVQRPTRDKPPIPVAASPFTLAQDRRLSPDAVLGARSSKVAALLARTAEAAR